MNQKNWETKILKDLRQEFSKEVSSFIARRQVPSDSMLQFEDTEAAEPVFVVTGASFTAFDEAVHGKEDSHAFYKGPTSSGKKYLINNTAAVVERLINEGRRVLVHSSNPDLVRALMLEHKNGDKVRVVGGELDKPEILKTIYRELESMGAEQPISDMSLCLYQSFAQQGNGEPFKPLHNEPLEQVERAAVKRLRFFYNMAALGYDCLVNRDLPDLRVVSLSSLAANRPSYGLLADAADKFMNELVWRNFHIEANASLKKPVSVYQIKPGITTACDVYQRATTLKTLRRESIADGFPMDKERLKGNKPLPRISAGDVAWVAHKMMVAPYESNPNDNMPKNIKALLYGGYTPQELKELLTKSIKIDGDNISIDPDKTLPEHLFTRSTRYGMLPPSLKKGEYQSISLCPPGQKF